MNEEIQKLSPVPNKEQNKKKNPINLPMSFILLLYFETQNLKKRMNETLVNVSLKIYKKKLDLKKDEPINFVH